MSKWRALELGLLACLAAGCAAEEGMRSTSGMQRFRGAAGPTGPDVVHMDVALVEQPPGDGYLNQELWDRADEQMLPLEVKARLEDNGFRIGKIAGITPPGLQLLLTSERSCPSPRRVALRAGQSRDLLLGPPHAVCEYHLRLGEQSSPLQLAQAQCVLTVTPTLTSDGGTRLQFTPLVRHGQAKLMPRPAPDRSGWLLSADQPTERCAALTWEVELAPNEYVVVGGRIDCPDTLGQRAFVRRDEVPPVQRLLVIRTGRTAPTVSMNETDEPNEPRRFPPLAFHASCSTGSGTLR